MSVKKRFVLLAATLLMAGCLQVLAAQQPVSVKGDEVTYDSRTGEAVITGNAVISQADGTVSGDKAVYNLKSGDGEISGRVVARRGEVDLTAARLLVRSNGEEMVAMGGTALTRGTDRLQAPTISYFSAQARAVTSDGRARLDSAEGVLQANVLEYFLNESRAVATGNVHIESDRRNLEATAERADYQGAAAGKRAEVVLVGNARAVQDGNVLTGNRLVMSLDDRVSEAEGNAKLVIAPKPEMKKEGQ